MNDLDKYKQMMLDALSRFEPVTASAWQDLHPLCTYKKFDRGQYLIRQGEFPKDIVFILSGVMRAFYRSGKGADYNKTFFTPASFAGPLAALLQNDYSHLYFQAMTDTEVLKFEYGKFLALFGQHRCLETVMRKVIELEWVIKKEQREIQLVMCNATQRYAYFQEEYPGLEKLIPQYHIASHLGITPIQLSRIRAKIAENKPEAGDINIG